LLRDVRGHHLERNTRAREQLAPPRRPTSQHERQRHPRSQAKRAITVKCIPRRKRTHSKLRRRWSSESLRSTPAALPPQRAKRAVRPIRLALAVATTQRVSLQSMRGKQARATSGTIALAALWLACASGPTLRNGVYRDRAQGWSIAAPPPEWKR